MKSIAPFFLVLVVMCGACKKKRICDQYIQPAPAPPVHLELQRAGINIPRDTIREMKCYWYKAGVKTYMQYNATTMPKVTYLEYYDEFLKRQIVDSFSPLLNVYALSVAPNGSNKFFLEFPDNKLDSIVLEGETTLQTLDNECVTNGYSYKSILYHGKWPPVDTQMRKKNVYLTAYICDKPN